jgi:hypothetical protein
MSVLYNYSNAEVRLLVPQYSTNPLVQYPVGTSVVVTKAQVKLSAVSNPERDSTKQSTAGDKLDVFKVQGRFTSKPLPVAFLNSQVAYMDVGNFKGELEYYIYPASPYYDEAGILGQKFFGTFTVK